MGTEVTKVESGGLAKMREPFPKHQISELPKPTKEQNKCDPREKRNCTVCGGWHHPKVRHLSYVGHAAITDRLLDTDPNWSWAPMALDPMGLPLFDSSGGLWIKLTVCGVTRLGYGHAEEKEHMDPGSREKEVIGDALRNACMRFGAALDLWHKGDLHKDVEGDVPLGEFVDEPQLPAADKKVASAPKANGASAEQKPAPAKELKTNGSAPQLELTTTAIPELDVDKLKELISSGMKQLGWKMIKLREFYEANVDPEPFKSADEMPIEKMRMLHRKLVEKHGIAPF